MTLLDATVEDAVSFAGLKLSAEERRQVELVDTGLLMEAG